MAGEEKLKRALACASVELRAVLARTTITMEEMVGLRPGDLLTTEKPVESTVTIQVEGRPKFLGRLGQFRGNRAVRITRIADAEGNADPCPAGSTA